MIDDTEPQFELAVPFVACASQGGPYEDESFVAGFRLGEIDTSLSIANAMQIPTMPFAVQPALLPQLELIGMFRNYPVMRQQSDETGDWVRVTFVRAGIESQ